MWPVGAFKEIPTRLHRFGKSFQAVQEIKDKSDQRSNHQHLDFATINIWTECTSDCGHDDQQRY